jgi:3-dehydroquinate synthase
VIVRHRFGEYEVVCSDAAIALGDEREAFVITDENVMSHWRSLCGRWPVRAVKAGEGSKSIDTYNECLEWLAGNRASRSCTIFAIGGGVVGDLAGFVAATYMRGVRVIQVPTTLLAMVDSSVGGKVGIDLKTGKNLAGAFHPPSRVIIDLQTLSTLPRREFNNGAAEIWKYGAILDPLILEQLEANPLGPGDDRLPAMVMHCVDLKRQIVESDEYERSGTRAVLNFGHTLAHAIERQTGYGPVLHGEAVAIGMVVEAAIGEKLGMSPMGAATRLDKGLESQGLPTRIPTCAPGELLEAMRLDKKASQGRLAFALLQGYGSCKLVADVPESVVLECVREYL